jgi:hypothetical protein
MARSFNGSTQYLSRNDAVVASMPLTLAYWGYSTSDANAQDGFSLGQTGGSQCYRLVFKGNDGGDPIISQIIGSGTDPSASTSTGYSVNTWHHACGVFAAINDIRAFIDGGSKGTNASGTGSLTPDRTSIGALLNHFSGRVAEVAIWNVALTDDEVAVLGAGYSPLLVRPQSLVAYWPLASRQSPEIDLIGGYNMTLTNAPPVANHPSVIYEADSALVLPDITNYGVSLKRLSPLHALMPSSDYPVMTLRNRRPILSFAKGFDQYAMFDFVMPQRYAGTGLAAVVHHSAAVSESGRVKIGISVERVGDGQQDVDSDGFGADNYQRAFVPTFNTEVTRARIRLNGGDMSSLAAGEKCRLKVTRLSSAVDDRAQGDWQLHAIDIRGK